MTRTGLDHNTPDYTTWKDRDLNDQAREGWTKAQAGGSVASSAQLMDAIRDSAIEHIREHLADIEPVLVHAHPTFLMAVNRVKRELDARTEIGSAGVRSLEHHMDGPLMQFNRIKRHIEWMRDVHAQIEKGVPFTVYGGIPQFTDDQLRARGFSEYIIQKLKEL